jgi:predicted HicB family RNase H-like nuclease
MSKKSFKGVNPALAFISGTEEPATEGKREDRPENEALNTLDTQNTDNTHIKQAARSERRTQDTPLKEGAKNAGKETKSKRLNLILQPSLFENMSKIAHMRQTSVNDLINTLLREYTEREADTINKYDNIFGSSRAV